MRHPGVDAFSDRTPLPETTEKFVASPADKSKQIAKMAVENFTPGPRRNFFVEQATAANPHIADQILVDLAIKEAEEGITLGVRGSISEYAA